MTPPRAEHRAVFDVRMRVLFIVFKTVTRVVV
jgi:hypothetical protein